MQYNVEFISWLLIKQNEVWTLNTEESRKSSSNIVILRTNETIKNKVLNEIDCFLFFLISNIVLCHHQHKRKPIHISLGLLTWFFRKIRTLHTFTNYFKFCLHLLQFCAVCSFLLQYFHIEQMITNRIERCWMKAGKN